jgi:hypothetical protein
MKGKEKKAKITPWEEIEEGTRTIYKRKWVNQDKQNCSRRF